MEANPELPPDLVAEVAGRVKPEPDPVDENLEKEPDPAEVVDESLVLEPGPVEEADESLDAENSLPESGKASDILEMLDDPLS